MNFQSTTKNHSGWREHELPPVSSAGQVRDRPAPGAGRHLRMILKESRERNAYSPQKFNKNFRRLLGLREVVGPRGQVKTVYDPKERKIWPEEFPICESSRELLGGDFVDALGNHKVGQSTALDLREALAPVTASTQQDINAYSIYVGGLVELKFLEGYQLPMFWGRQSVHEEPTSVREQRIICEANMNLPDRATQEANEYPNQGILPRWVIRPPTIKYGQRASLTKEAVVFGLGGELLSAIEGGGKALGYLEEYLIAATVQGKDIIAGTPGFQDGYTVNTYRYNAEPNDTANATYQAAVGTGTSLKYNYANQFGGHPILSWQDLQFARAKLALMREFETGYPILSDGAKDLICQPANHDTVEVIVHAKQVFPAYGSSGLSGTSTGAAQVGAAFSDNPSGNAGISIKSSPIWNKQLVDAGVSQANADLYWQYLDMKRAFGWATVWPTKVTQANVLSAGLVSADIVGLWVYSWFGCPYVREPRLALQFSN